VLVGRANRHAASQPLEDVRPCGEDVRACVRRQRTVEATVVEAVLAERLKAPLAGPAALVPRRNAQLGRNDLRVAPIEEALEQISCVPGLRTRRRQLEAGHVPYQEPYQAPYQAASLVTEIRERRSLPAGLDASHGGPSSDRGMRLADPTALTAWVTPDLPLAEVADSRCWLTFRMTLCAGNVPLSVLGRWCGVHKTTIVRGV
jgi:hypothetical protein